MINVLYILRFFFTDSGPIITIINIFWDLYVHNMSNRYLLSKYQIKVVISSFITTIFSRNRSVLKTEMIYLIAKKFNVHSVSAVIPIRRAKRLPSLLTDTFQIRHWRLNRLWMNVTSPAPTRLNGSACLFNCPLASSIVSTRKLQHNTIL